MVISIKKGSLFCIWCFGIKNIPKTPCYFMDKNSMISKNIKKQRDSYLVVMGGYYEKKTNRNQFVNSNGVVNCL